MHYRAVYLLGQTGLLGYTAWLKGAVSLLKLAVVSVVEQVGIVYQNKCLHRGKQNLVLKIYWLSTKDGVSVTRITHRAEPCYGVRTGQ